MHVLLVDDHEVLCEMFARHIEQTASQFLTLTSIRVTPLFTLAGAIAAISEDPRPDYVFLDLSLDRESRGAGTLERFQAANPHKIPVAIFTGLPPDDPQSIEIFRKCYFELKAKGILLKGSNAKRMFMGLARLLEGEEWIPSEVLRELSTPLPTSRGISAEDILTPRERDVACCLTEGLRNKEIARKLNIAPEYVGQITSSIYSKLEVRNWTEAANKLLRKSA